MIISERELKKIFLEEFNRAKMLKNNNRRLQEGTSYDNPIRLDQYDLRRIIMNESTQLKEERVVNVTPNILKRIIMEEARKIGR